MIAGECGRETLPTGCCVLAVFETGSAVGLAWFLSMPSLLPQGKYMHDVLEG